MDIERGVIRMAKGICGKCGKLKEVKRVGYWFLCEECKKEIEKE